MRRIRWTMLVVTVTLMASVALLVGKAIRSQRLEQDSRNLAVAERVFDEMERELSAFLVHEEERSYLEYRYFFVPEGAVIRNDLIRSPLADPPAEPFVLGHFQIEPDGRVSSPLVPEDARLASSAGWRVGTDVPAIVSQLEAVIRHSWGAPGDDSTESPAPLHQAPGTTVELPDEADRKKDESLSDAIRSSAILEEFNRGVSLRSDRASKVTKGRPADAYRFSKEGSAAVQRQLYEQEPQAEAQALDRTEASVDVRQDPMVSRRAGDDRLLLYRTVTVADLTYRQGLVVDLAALFATVSARVVEGRAYRQRTLTEIELVRASPSGADSGRTGRGFRHRFAAPFDDLVGELYVSGLPGLVGTVYVYALSVLVLVVAPLGLFAVYRMVAAQTEFSERRANFVSAVSHELKTPLTAIRMYGEMLRDGMVASDDKRQRYYGIITAESERLTRLVDNVLELGRLQRGARTVDVIAGDPTPVIEEALATLRPHAEENGFELRFEAAAVAPVSLDRDALKQIVFNLVDNSIKYARAAALKEVAIDLRPGEDGAVIVVRDHGPGVESGQLGALFDPFYRGEDELTRQAKGAGIGLALVQGLAAEMGAVVSVRNAIGGGLEVRVELRRPSA